MKMFLCVQSNENKGVFIFNRIYWKVKEDVFFRDKKWLKFLNWISHQLCDASKYVTLITSLNRSLVCALIALLKNNYQLFSDNN